jgi:NADP-dependent 3-hydroxy acid dehydrogenase YdfG
VSAPRVAVVTGAGSGIGAATAVELGRLGFRVVLSDLPAREMEDVAAAVHEAGGEAAAVAADVRDFGDVSALVQSALDRFGAVDVLVANAGISERSTVSGGDPDAWRAVVETNLLGAAYCARAVLPHMLERGSGHIVLTASTGGREIYVGEPMYIASKWGVVGFGQALRKEVEGAGVRVTLVEPDVVDTPLTRGIPSLSYRLEAGRALQAEDVARVIAFVVSQPEHVAVNEVLVRPQFPDLDSSLGSRIGRKARRVLGG